MSLHLVGILLHGFGPRYDLPISRWLYFLAAGFVVVISFVLVVIFAGEQVGAKAIQYPRRASAWLTSAARSPWPRGVGGSFEVRALGAATGCGSSGHRE